MTFLNFFRSLPKGAPPPTGSEGEMAAARFLKRQGMKILVQNYRCRFGEIDLVTRDRDTLVFVEVKTRTSDKFGDPSQAVTTEKKRHMSRVALDYMRRLRLSRVQARFDIVEVTAVGAKWTCHHIPNAFPLSEPYLG